MQASSFRFEFLWTISKFRKRKKFGRRLFTSSIKRITWHFHVVVVQWPQRNIQTYTSRVVVLPIRRTMQHRLTTTTFVITTMFFRPKRQNTESFYYFEDPVNSNTSLLRPGVYGPMVVAPTGFSCIAFWTFSLPWPWPWPSLSWHLKLPNNKRLPCSAYPCFPQQMWFPW